MGKIETHKILIIGGGITGLSIAYHLSKYGMEDVILLEKEYLGSGSTGRGAAGIRTQFPDKNNIEMMKESKNIWKKLSEEFGFEYKDQGYLFLIRSEDELENYILMKNLQNSIGVPTKIISDYEVKDICEHIDISNVTAGCYNPKDSRTDPFEVLSGFRKYLKNTDIEIKERTKVKNVKINKNDKLVKTSKGFFKTENIINASGGWAPKIGKMMGIDIPIKPYKHQILVTEPFKKGSIEPMIIDMENNGAYLTQSNRGGSLYGGIGNKPGEPPTYDINGTIEFVEKTARSWIKIIPSLKSVNMIRQWAGLYAITPDENPLIGEYKVDGHYIAAGFSGHGYMMGPIVGKCLAELLLKGDTKYPIDYYDPYRIDRGDLRDEGVLQAG